MKYLLITLTLLGSCAIPQRTITKLKVKPIKKTYTAKMSQCIFRLIEQNGVTAKDSRETCVSIYRRD